MHWNVSGISQTVGFEWMILNACVWISQTVGFKWLILNACVQIRSYGWNVSETLGSRISQTVGFEWSRMRVFESVRRLVGMHWNVQWNQSDSWFWMCVCLNQLDSWFQMIDFECVCSNQSDSWNVSETLGSEISQTVGFEWFRMRVLKSVRQLVLNVYVQMPAKGVIQLEYKLKGSIQLDWLAVNEWFWMRAFKC